jgi:hypothetical protein
VTRTEAHPTIPAFEGNSLRDVVSRVHLDFSKMQAELQRATREIARLQEKLAQRPPAPRSIPDLDLASLRRGVTFHCHPDRGGDPILMRGMNVLFDFLEESQWLNPENA